MGDIWYIVGSFIGGFGGSALAAYIKQNSEYRKLMFETKLTKYSNLIQALQSSVPDPNSTKQTVVSAQKQVELVGTNEIIELSSRLFTDIDTATVRDKFIKAMRNDLKKYT